MTRVRAAAAGAAGALAWAAVEPLDVRVLGSRYSDVAFLGKAVARRRWRTVGLAWHVANGALFGLAFRSVAKRSSLPPTRVAVAMALAENTALYPLTFVTDRHHPARGHEDVAPLWNLRAFAQSTWRHALFGWVVGRVASTR